MNIDDPFSKYLKKDLVRFINPIYEAPFEERLKDLKRTIEMVESMLRQPDMLRPYGRNDEGLKDGEFALGNWIVRPRFK